MCVIRYCRRVSFILLLGENVQYFLIYTSVICGPETRIKYPNNGTLLIYKIISFVTQGLQTFQERETLECKGGKAVFDLKHNSIGSNV